MLEIVARNADVAAKEVDDVIIQRAMEISGQATDLFFEARAQSLQGNGKSGTLFISSGVAGSTATHGQQWQGRTMGDWLDEIEK